jgi:hypothetical protein
LASEDGTHLVFYKEDTQSLRLDLSGMPHDQRAFAVDTRGDEYQEIDLGELARGEHEWEAPYRSDWVVAVGYGG